MSDKEEGVGDDFEKEPEVKPKYMNKKARIKARYGEAAEDFSLKDIGYTAEEGIVMEGRKCTDPFCCAIFVIFVFMMFLISTYSVNHGNIKKFLAPMDGA